MKSRFEVKSSPKVVTLKCEYLADDLSGDEKYTCDSYAQQVVRPKTGQVYHLFAHTFEDGQSTVAWVAPYGTDSGVARVLADPVQKDGLGIRRCLRVSTHRRHFGGKYLVTVTMQFGAQLSSTYWVPVWESQPQAVTR